MKDLNYYLNLPYTIEVKKIPDDEGGGYAAFMPDFLAAKATFWGDGDTPAQAIDDLKLAFEATLEAMLENGAYIPEPKQEQNIADKAKNVTITLKESVINEIDAAASSLGISRSALIAIGTKAYIKGL